MTGRGDQATLNQWISGLQQNNPILGQIPTLFRLDAGPRELQSVADSDPGHGYRTGPQSEAQDGAEPSPEAEPDIIVEEEPRRSQGMKQ